MRHLRGGLRAGPEPDEVLGDAQDPEYRARYYERHPEYRDEEEE